MALRELGSCAYRVASAPRVSLRPSAVQLSRSYALPVDTVPSQDTSFDIQELESSSTFSSTDIVSTPFDPVTQARLRKQQLPSSR